MKGYFFVSTFLPPLQFGSPPPVRFERVAALFEENLGARDLKKVRKLLSLVDLQNVPRLLKEEPLDLRGNLTEKELDEAFLNRDGLPNALFEEGEEGALRAFPRALFEFLWEGGEIEEGFLGRYFRFEWEWRLLIALLRGRELKREVEPFISSNPYGDFLVAEALSQSVMPIFDFPIEHRDLGERIAESRGSAIKEQSSVSRYRFKWIKEQLEGRPFSLDHLLGYMAQLLIIEDEEALSKVEGGALLDNIMRGER